MATLSFLLVNSGTVPVSPKIGNCTFSPFFITAFKLLTVGLTTVYFMLNTFPSTFAVIVPVPGFVPKTAAFFS